MSAPQQSHSAGTVVHLVCPAFAPCADRRTRAKVTTVSKSLIGLGRPRSVTAMNAEREQRSEVAS